MLERLEARKPDRWIEAGIALLSAGHGQQVEIERRAKKLVSTVGKQRERAASHNALIFVASVNSHEVIALLAGPKYRVNLGRYPEVSLSEARAKAVGLLEQAKRGVNPKEADSDTDGREPDR